MAPRKAKPAAKKRATKAAAYRLQDKVRRVARDPFAGPSSEKLIERSLDRGTKTTLAQFRASINWE